MIRAPAPRSMSATLLIAAATLTIGFGLKSACLSEPSGRGCYSDLRTQYEPEGMDQGRIPYRDPCPDYRGPYPCDEYPALTMGIIWLAGAVTGGPTAFFLFNAAVVFLAGIALVAATHRVSPSAALLIALSPTLLVSSFLNWDLVAVAATALALIAAIARRPISAGIAWAIGALAKLYPLVLLPAIAAARSGSRTTKLRTAIVIACVGGGVIALVQTPITLMAPSGWARPLRFASVRSPDIDSLWYIACSRTTGLIHCPWSGQLVNLVSGVVVVVAVIALWAIRRRRRAHLWIWSLPVPLIAIILLAGKVYSPQYSLWLLPWLALWSRRRMHLWVAFAVTDLAVSLARLFWFQAYTAAAPTPGALALDGSRTLVFHAALIARAAVLLWIIGAWSRARDDDPSLLDAPLPAGAPA